MKTYAFGGFGANNVGDEAIFEGLQAVYPGAIEIYINKSYRSGSIWYGDIFHGQEQFEPGSHLIIGGGGILHCRGAVEDYLKMAKIAKAAGCRVTIERVGLEGLQPEYEDVTKELLAEAESISVRTPMSCRIARSLGFFATVVRDFAYEGPYESALNNKQLLDDVTIGVSLSCVPEHVLEQEAARIQTILKVANVLFIPHSRAFVSHRNNDIVTGHQLWSLADTWRNTAGTQFQVLPDIMSPAETIAVYRCLDGIYSSRYHGCIFAHMTGRPLIGKIHSLKGRAFFEQHNDPKILGIEEGASENAFLSELERWAQELATKDTDHK